MTTTINTVIIRTGFRKMTHSIDFDDAAKKKAKALLVHVAYVAEKKKTMRTQL